MSYEDRLLDGVAAWLAAAALEVPDDSAARSLTHRGDGSVYEVGETGIYRRVHPDQGDYVSLDTFGGTDDPSLSDSTANVEVTIRGTDAFVTAVAVLAFDALHGLWSATLGSVHIVASERSSGTSLGQDSTGRQGRIENYSMAVHRPSPHRS